jgi:hypothetical protein
MAEARDNWEIPDTMAVIYYFYWNLNCYWSLLLTSLIKKRLISLTSVQDIAISTTARVYVFALQRLSEMLSSLKRNKFER